MKLSVVLSDDWELRGDGSGDMDKIQFATLARLLDIYERYGFRASINAEVQQQLHHLKYGERFPRLAEAARRWEHVVTDAYRRGHDVQLHVHSQWEGATYDGVRWRLPGSWSLLAHPRETLTRMIRESRAYLENLLRPLNPEYRCVSFRAGAWTIAPSDALLDILVEEGIVFDTSIVGGLRLDNPMVRLDYTDCDETCLPYYPCMTDARRMSDRREAIVSVPTLSFVPSRGTLLVRDLRYISSRLRAKRSGGQPTAGSGGDAAAYAVWSKGMTERFVSRCFPRSIIADISALTFEMMKEMIACARRNCAARGMEEAPVVLTNHTKDLADYSAVERFAHYIAGEEDIEVITSSELAARLERGVYKVLMREGRGSVAA